MNDIVKLGEGMTQSLLKAAQEQVTKAQTILDQTQSLADIIMTQVRAQAQQIENMNVRFKAFGEQMLDAHRKLNEAGDYSVQEQAAAERIDARTPAATPFAGAPVSALDRLHTLAGLAPRNVAKVPGIGTLDPSLTIDPKRANDPDYRAPDPARPGGLPWPVANIDRFRVNRTDRGEDRDDPATGPDRSF